MSNYKPTAAQQQAIVASGSVLVSAAAGSGKTATLCHRIVQQLKSGEDITRMLIVTFTRAAAQDLREKLLKAIRAELKIDPSNKALARQLLKIPHAQIGTTDSFCLDLVKRYSTELNLPSSFRLMDDGEAAILSQSVMDKVIDEFYSRDDENFVNLCDILTRNSDDEVAQSLLTLYYATQSHPNGVNSLMQTEKNVDCESIVIAHILEQLRFMERTHRAALEHFQTNEKMQAKAAPVFEADLLIFERLRLACNVGVLGICAALEVKSDFNELRGVPKSEQDELYDFFASWRSRFKKNINDNKLGLTLSIAKFEADGMKSAQQIAILHKVLSVFHVELCEKKQQRGTFEHADIARFVLELLYNGSELSVIAREIAAEFDQVYVDEYQDTNAIQDMIYQAISRENLFIIGDGKQSIYGFRGAKPDIFYAYRELYGRSEGGTNIFLSENFRCSKNIIATGNAVFSSLFPIGGTPYLEQDKLVYGKSETDPIGEPCVNIHICPTSQSEYDLLVALMNKQIEAGREWKDIAVLVSKNDIAAQVAQYLEKIGIPASLEGSKRNFWDNGQVRSLLCLLASAVNPTNDIYLAGALTSERFGASIEDIALIRLDGEENGDLYRAVLAMQSNCDICAKLADYLVEMRRAQARFSIAEILRSLIAETFGDGCLYETESVHLRRFYNIAENYQANALNPDLAGFVRYIELLSQQGKSDESSVSINAVRVMTIHKSKGLEFPVCFLFGAGKTLKKDNKSKILYDGDLGAAMVVVDGLSERRALDFNALTMTKETSEQNEAIRRLYVALTRAKSELVIIGSPRKYGAKAPNVDDYMKTCELEAEMLCSGLLRQRSSYLQWILLALYSSNSAQEAYKIHMHESITPSSAVNEKNAEEFSNRREIVIHSFSQEMPQIPAKLSVSRLHPTVLDETDDGAAILEPEFDFVLDVPNFIAEHKKVSNTPDPREIGIATHAFMQFCDFAYVEKHGVEFEVMRLVDKRFLSPAVAQLVNIAQIKAFFDSAIYREMKIASKLYRERRFNVKLPASAFTAVNAELLCDESVLVQGVIDCYFVNSDGKLTLVDYKTDSFPLEMLQNPEKVAAILCKRHKLQLQYYCTAIERLTKRKVDRVALYSFALGDVVEVGIG